MTTPAVCWNTPCTPQKQPPATTAVWRPSEALNVLGGSGDDHGVFRGAQRRDRESGDRQRANGGGAKRKAAELAAGHGGFLLGFLWVKRI